jgi:hypothetical protein
MVLMAATPVRAQGERGGAANGLAIRDREGTVRDEELRVQRVIS